jgi:hypothetical protein
MPYKCVPKLSLTLEATVIYGGYNVMMVTLQGVSPTLQGVLTGFHDLGPWPLSQGADVQFLKKLLLSLSVLHIFF